MNIAEKRIRPRRTTPAPEAVFSIDLSVPKNLAS
jgi:hypothetical protein